MKGAAASLETYWAREYPAPGGTYRAPRPIELFTASTTTGCGGASRATGPVYCPLDETLYIDTSFFVDLRDRFGASGGPRAQLYVVAHEWVGSASTVPDRNGVPYLKPPTRAEIADALSAAAAVGDDRIQAASGQVNPESWTHGSSEQRQRWFTTGRTSSPSAARL